MRITDEHEPELASLGVSGRTEPIFAPGSDAAVSREAPVLTGDGVLDTQLENTRRILGARVWSMYRLVLRVKALRLWAVKRKESDHAFPPSLIKRDDHPLVAVMVRQAQELAKIDAIDCSGDPKQELMQVQVRLKALSDIQENAVKVEKLGTESLRQAKELLQTFHAMAQQYKMHREKLDVATSDASDAELSRIAARAKPAEVMPVLPKAKLENFMDPNR